MSEAHQSKLYHLGFSQGISRTTPDANEKRDWRIYADFVQVLIAQARLVNPELSLEGLAFDNRIYALDSSTIDLCLEVFWWAKFRKHKAAIKLHVAGYSLPNPLFCAYQMVFYDVNVLDILDFEADAFYVMDRGWDWARLHRINQAGAFFVTRAKSNLLHEDLFQGGGQRNRGAMDQIICLKNYKAAKDYPAKLRRVKYYDEENNKTLVFISNNFEITALEVALLYKNRWQIELFSSGLSSTCASKSFGGKVPTRKTQIWVAVCTFILVKILKEKHQILQSMNEILQILSVSVFDKAPVNQLFNQLQYQKDEKPFSNQLNMFDL
ncbi:MAG: IS4 family transposase [Haliscomenobacter sp.]|nr:IS4 family transposase [Haliscomenobacter sp.]